MPQIPIWLRKGRKPGAIRHQLTPSGHGSKRLAQRNLAPAEVEFVVKHGRVLYRTGIVFYFLGSRDVPRTLRRSAAITRLAGTTVLLAHDGTLITAYKDPHALRKIKRKPKRRLRSVA